MMGRLTVLVLALVLAGCGNGDPLPLVGTLERERLLLRAPVAETVASLEVAEGDTVGAGSVVARLDADEAEQRLATAEAGAERAAARLAELEHGARAQELASARARLAGARETVRLAQRTLERMRRLAERELASPSDVDDAERILAGATTERDMAAAALDELEEGTRSEVLDQARAELAAARAEVRRARDARDDLVLRAPLAARVDALPLHVGERARVGETIAVLLGGPAYARVYVPAAVRPRLQIGMPASVEITDGKRLEARIRTISAEAAFTPFFALTERDRGRLAYRAEIELDAAPDDLPIGAPVTVSFPALDGGAADS